MSARLLIFATHIEAQHTLELLKPEQISENLYSFNAGLIAICGYGLLTAAQATTEHAPRVEEVWNFGAAGSLLGSHGLGDTMEIAAVNINPILPKEASPHTKNVFANTYPEINLGAEGARLITSLYPIHDASLRATLAHDGDLIDMEGYGVAHAALQCGKLCRLWKVVSDFTNPDGPKSIANMLEEVSINSARVVDAEFSHQVPTGI